MLRLKLKVHRVDLDIESEARVLCLFGPSGSGKTTCLEAVAGLLRPDAGELTIDNHSLMDLPPRERNVGYLPQDAPLFPHLDVKANLLYGAPKSDPTDVARSLDIEPLLDRHPNNLSGGERRRVALGRALLVQPRILLLDEPFAGLEAPLRARLLAYVARLDVPRTLLVTHDPRDAIGLADEVVCLTNGRETSRGRPDELFDPRSDLVEPAAVLHAKVTQREDPYAQVDVNGQTLHAHLPGARDGENVRLAIRADEITLSLRRHEDLSARNQLDCTIEKLEERGAQVLAHLDGGIRLYALLEPRSVASLKLRAGTRVVAQFKASTLKRAGI